MDYKGRVRALQREIEKRKLDSFLVTNETNVSYLSGFKGTDATLLVGLFRSFFITDSRYLEEARESIKNFDIVLVEVSNYHPLKKLIDRKRMKRIGFESMNLPYEVVARLKTIVKRAKFEPFKGVIEALRSIKDEEEISLIRRSIRCTRDVLKRAIARIKPGLSEKSLARSVEIDFIESGGQAAFEPIVAFGRNSSKPHARAGDTKIGKNGHLMIDIGCNLNGYNSDYTRTALLGRVKEKIRKIYDVVHKAQEAAFGMIMPGARISDIDLAARRYIQRRGFGKFFGHSLGHGVGMEVHEKPPISRINHDILRPGMVFTVEPAIYIPKVGGVRIEDMVLVTANGFEILTR